MRQYSINHDTKAFNAFCEHYNLDTSIPGTHYNFMKEKSVRQIGSKQAWIIEDADGNKWLQSYYTVVSVKWADTKEVEHFGKWSVTTSRHQTAFLRMA